MKLKHSSKAQYDERCLRLIQTLGYAGYGLYWGLIETLYQTEERSISLDSIPQVASRLRARSKTILKLLNDFDLFRLSEDGKTFVPKSQGLYYIDGKNRR